MSEQWVTKESFEVEVQPQLSKPPALKDWAYKIIKDSILSFRFPPGAQLHIEQLADEMGLSRTPIREALLKLESDGLVRTVPRVGFFVTEITKRDLEELFELRELLESHAAGKIASLLTDDDLAYIDRLLETSVSAVERGDLGEFLKAEIAFHTFLIESCGNRRLIEVMKGLEDLMYRERVLSLRSLENVRKSLTEHQRIAEALHQRDGELASRCMREHIRNVRKRMLQLVDLGKC
ncbi:MAG TPA: GntR family transcriptional regulator [Anaerolineae bacterium]|nr:GntR family transcriptional regulator [Anaerolineae bacterium]